MPDSYNNMNKGRNRIILSLGSNLSPKKNIDWACDELRKLLPDIVFSKAVYTKPCNWHCEDLFLNCVAIADTDYLKDELVSLFKSLERESGRTAESKIIGKISLDIDLLQWNDCILKPGDMKREYVMNGLLSLEAELQNDERSK